MISQPRRTVCRLAVLISLAAGAAACAGRQPAPRAAVAKPPLEIGERAAAVALRQVGTPYRYGGSDPSGFDCSGLVHYSYASAGKSIPRTTDGLWAELTPVDAVDLRIGDLLFFRISGKISHVGMYVGAGRFVHAPSTGNVVQMEKLGSTYYRQALIRAGRPR